MTGLETRSHPSFLTAVILPLLPNRRRLTQRVNPLNIYRISRWVVLTGFILAFFLLLKKPAPVARPLDTASVAANLQSYQSKLQELQQARARGESQSEIRLTADEVSAAMRQAAVSAPAVENADGTDPAPASAPAPAPADTQGQVNDCQVSFEGDVARGQFSTEIEGKQVYVTLAGHLGSRDGYATFAPTEFKIGDLSLPVAMVNQKLQERLQEQRGRLKLPEYIGDLRVANGELVIKEK
jgi:hypothetical protein